MLGRIVLRRMLSNLRYTRQYKVLPFARLLMLLLLLSHCSPVAASENLEQMASDRYFPEVLKVVEERLPGASGKERQRLLLLKAECLVGLRRPGAKEAMSALDPRTSPARFFRVRGQWQTQREAYALARRDFRQALKLQPEPREALRICLMAAEMEARAKRGEESRQHLSEALLWLSKQEWPPNVWRKYYSIKYYSLFRLGEKREANDTILLARAHLSSLGDPEGVAWSYSAEAREHNRNQRKKECRAAWAQALKFGPKLKATTYLRWGFDMVFHQDDLGEVRYLAELLEDDWPREVSDFEHYHLRFLQGQLWSKISEPNKALHYYRLAEEQAGPGRRFSGRHLNISLSFHRFGSRNGNSDMEIALWSQLRTMDNLNLPVSEVAEFMEAKLTKLVPEERSPWLFALGERLLPTNPERSHVLFRETLDQAEKSLRPRFLNAITTVYFENGQLRQARTFAKELREEYLGLEDESAFKLLRSLASQTVTGMPLQSLWFGKNHSLLSLNQALVSEENRRRGRALERVLEKEMTEIDKGPNRLKIAGLYRTQGDFLFVEGRLAEAAAAYEESRVILQNDARPTRLLDRYLALVHQSVGLDELALSEARSSRLAYAGSDRLQSEVLSAAVELNLLLETRKSKEALKLCEEFLDRLRAGERAAFEFARVRALSQMGRHQEAHGFLKQMQVPRGDTEFLVVYRLRQAEILLALGRPDESLAKIRSAWELAARLESVLVEEVALAWQNLKPESVPKDMAQAILKKHLSPEQIRRLRGEPPVATSLLSSTDFLKLTDTWMTRFPKMSTHIPLLPQALIARSEKLKNDEAIVQYFSSDRDLFCMVGTNKGMMTRQLKVERDTLKRWIEELDKDPRAARKLGGILLDPLESVCSGRTLIFVSHGVLRPLYWDRLQLADGPLVNNYPWKLWASESGPSFDIRSGRKLLALGGVAGTDLLASRHEVEAIGSSVKSALAVLTGSEASRDNLLKFLPQADILHLATHSTPEFLQLSGDRLSRDEIYELPLRKGALVVLSSCEGAKPGAQERAPITLGSSFLAAGASEVVASLGEVGDQEAEAFFLEFYRELALGVSPARALQKAKIARKSSAGQDWFKFVVLGG